MKRPVTSLCRRPGKKTACGQSVPGAGTISAHRDALRRASGTAGQKPPGRGRKNSPGGGRELCAGRAHGGTAGNGRCLVPGRHRTGRPPGQRARPGAKTAPGGSRELCAGCAHGRAAGNGVSGAGKASHWAPGGAEGTPGRKTSPRRGPEAVWMRDMGVTCPGRSV